MTQEATPKKRTPSVIDREIQELWQQSQTLQSSHLFGYPGSPQQAFLDSIFKELDSLDTEIRTLILLQCPTIQKHINSVKLVDEIRTKVRDLEKEKKAYYAASKAKQKAKLKEAAFQGIKDKVGHFILKEQFSIADSLAIGKLTPTEKKYLTEYIANAKKEKETT